MFMAWSSTRLQDVNDLRQQDNCFRSLLFSTLTFQSVRSDGIFDGHFITNLLQSVPLKILKIGNIWLNYVHVYVSLYDYRPNSSDNRCCAAKDAKTYWRSNGSMMQFCCNIIFIIQDVAKSRAHYMWYEFSSTMIFCCCIANCHACIYN